ncbi:MAG: DUF2283 domain-containing protein [Dehalococcoidia bacterium]|nr:DUF2283 domain-containing protein [Dehalococcoidia bacterium]
MEKKVDEYGIDWETLSNLLQFDVEYDPQTDIWFAHSKHERPAISIDRDDGIWLRIDAETGEILGVEIEDFKKIFLKKHREIAKEKNTYIKPIINLVRAQHCMA